METFSVGQIAKMAAVNVETLRYYEKLRLMPKPKRKESKYRMYESSDLARLLFIRRAKELGFTLKEIKELLSLRIESESKCGDVKNMADIKIIDIENRITDLKKIKKHLELLAHQCVNVELSTEECPIVKSLIF